MKSAATYTLGPYRTGFRTYSSLLIVLREPSLYSGDIIGGSEVEDTLSGKATPTARSAHADSSHIGCRPNGDASRIECILDCRTLPLVNN